MTAAVAATPIARGLAADVPKKKDRPDDKAAEERFPIELIRERLNVPLGIAAVLAGLLRREPSALNTDWSGSMPVEALLLWSRRGLPEGRALAERWFAYHLDHDRRLSNAEFLRSYQGYPSRVVRSGLLPFTTYAGLYGLAFPCHELYRLTGDPRAHQVCLDIADAILHLAPREGHGLILHDDGMLGGKQGFFTIPDAIYFAVRALAIASILDPQTGPVYRKQALYQIRVCTEIFLDKKLGLARTMLTAAGTGKSYWCRASGWLMYAMVGVLRYLPKEHPQFAELTRDLKVLADGVAAAAGPNGGLRALANDPSTPEETTGTAMCLAGIMEGVAKRWLPDVYAAFCRRAWDFLLRHVRPDGTIFGVYTGWALTAEEGKVLMDQARGSPGWIPAMLLFAAYERHEAAAT